jgi:hypothetical protein
MPSTSFPLFPSVRSGICTRPQWFFSKTVGAIGVASKHLILLKNPPLLKKSPNMPKSSQVEKRPGSVESDSFGVGGLFWWCFQVLLFDHLGFFSRINI